MHQKTTINFREMLLWEPKMYRLALQLLGMLGNDLGQPWHVLQRPRHALQGSWHALQGPWPTSACFLQRPRSPTSKRNPSPTCCLISCQVKGVVYHQVSYLLWEPKICRFALQLLGMLGNVLGMLCEVFGRPRHAFCNVLGAPHRRETPLVAS